MLMKRILLGTTALIGAGLIAGAAPAQAQQGPVVSPGGRLDVTVSGFARFLAGIGDLKEKTGNPNGGSFDFRNDTEVHILARGKDEATGIDYGATIEFEADTNRSDNTDETWVFLKGAFGEFRFGDEDGAADLMKIGAFTIAGGTGGIEGVIVDTPAVVAGVMSGDATKIVYFSPSIAGFQLGVSYTPSSGSSGDNLRSTNTGAVDDWIEGGVAYTGNFGGFGIKASVIGSMGHINQDVGDDDVQKLYGGISTTLFGFKVAGGFGTEEFGAIERDWFNAGAAFGYGPFNIFVNYGKVIDADNAPEPSNLVVGADVGLMPGVQLSAEVSMFDEDRGGDDDGVVGVVRLGVAF